MDSFPSPQRHKSVLLEESIQFLEIQNGDTIVDGTFGGGGHSKTILERYDGVTMICVDLDEEARERFNKLFSTHHNAIFIHANFKDVDSILQKAGKQEIQKVLLDLGTSTFQLLSDTRGFSFQSDTPLKMTFSKEGSHTGFTAEDIVNKWEETSIADIIYYYGEERMARKIAHAIVTARKEKSITSSKDLANLIEKTIPRRGRIHPATKTFQALRIAVNDELGVLHDALTQWWNKLSVNGRIAVITFHSLEDRIVKRWMTTLADPKRVITKKPITPSRNELQTNSRSRSAKLRVIEKL